MFDSSPDQEPANRRMSGDVLFALLTGQSPEEDPWQAQALCAQTDPEVFFPEKGIPTREAKRVCASCPVQEECLEYALKNDERFGVWGGLSLNERRALHSRVA